MPRGACIAARDPRLPIEQGQNGEGGMLFFSLPQRATASRAARLAAKRLEGAAAVGT